MKFEALVSRTGPDGAVDDRRRAPRRQLVAVGLPDGLACLELQREQERIRLRIDLENDEVAPDDRRAGRSPLDRRDVVGAQIEPAQIHLPAQRPVDVVRDHALRPEPRDDHPAVGRRRGASVSVLDVALVQRLALARHPFPDRLAGPLVDGHHHEAVARPIGRRVSVAIEPLAEACFRVAADRRRHEQPVAPDHRARMGEPRDPDAPQDVRAGGGVPAVRQVLAVSHARCQDASKRRPAALRRSRCGQRRTRRARGADDAPRGMDDGLRGVPRLPARQQCTDGDRHERAHQQQPDGHRRSVHRSHRSPPRYPTARTSNA